MLFYQIYMHIWLLSPQSLSPGSERVRNWEGKYIQTWCFYLPADTVSIRHYYHFSPQHHNWNITVVVVLRPRAWMHIQILQHHLRPKELFTSDLYCMTYNNNATMLEVLNHSPTHICVPIGCDSCQSYHWLDRPVLVNGCVANFGF